jgi:hypothetical protein
MVSPENGNFDSQAGIEAEGNWADCLFARITQSLRLDRERFLPFEILRWLNELIQ